MSDQIMESIVDHKQAFLTVSKFKLKAVYIRKTKSDATAQANATEQVVESEQPVAAVIGAPRNRNGNGSRIIDSLVIYPDEEIRLD